MKTSLFAGAAVAVATIGLPILAWTASPAAAQTPPPPPAPPAATPAPAPASAPAPAAPAPAAPAAASTTPAPNPGDVHWRSGGGPWKRMEEGRIGPGGMNGGGAGWMRSGMMGPGMMGQGMDRPDMMMRQDWMRRRAMWQQQGWHHHWRMQHMMQANPQQRCEAHIARRAALRAYVVARLDLTTAQLPLWQKLDAQFDTADQAAHQLCASLPTAPQQQPQTFLDRVNRRAKVLQARLTALQAELPDMTALYQALSPQQRELVDHPLRHR